MLRVIVTSSSISVFSLASISSCHIARFSPGGPGIQTICLPSFVAHQPGAVPLWLTMNCAEGIRCACLTLWAGISWPRLRNHWRRFASSAACTAGVSPRAAATASRVRSSCVGPSPPVVKMMSERSIPRRKASASLGRSSPMMLTHCNRMPRAGSRPAIQLALVSVSSPISSSVPTEIISACTAINLLIGRRGGSRRGRPAAARRPGRWCAGPARR